MALYAWHGTESLQARSDRAETGLIGRSPTDSVDTFRIHTRRRGRGGSIGLGSDGCMGREGERDLGLRAFEQRTVSRARKRALLRSVWESDSDIGFFVINKHTARLWGNAARCALVCVPMQL